MAADIGYLERKVFNGVDVPLYLKRALSSEATFALKMIQQWGMVAAVEDGEDSHGRQKTRLLTPEELVERACQTAEAAFAEFTKREWTLSLPAPTAVDPFTPTTEMRGAVSQPD